MSPYVSIAGVFWAVTALTPVAIFIDNGYLMGVLFFAMALLPPTANTTIITEQLLLTPDARATRSAERRDGPGHRRRRCAGPDARRAADRAGRRRYGRTAGGIAAVTMLVTVSATLRQFPRRQTKVPAGSH
jgi:hypothetical protein